MIEVLIGNIASGKSTYASMRAEEDEAVIINDDAIIRAVHGGNYKLYSDSMAPLYKSIEMQMATVGISMGRIVVVDKPNLTVASRRRWSGIASSMGEPCQVMDFRCYEDRPSVHARRRFKSDSRGHSLKHWVAVAKTFRSRYQAPTAGEGFDSIVSAQSILGHIFPLPLEELL